MDEGMYLRFQALGDPTRLAVVERLLDGPASVSDLARALGVALPGLMKHLGVLERAGLIGSVKRGRVRTWVIDHMALRALERWVVERRRLWETRAERQADSATPGGVGRR